MGISEQTSMMKDSLLEAKDIINELLVDFGAPEEYIIRHITFDELVASLYKLKYVYELYMSAPIGTDTSDATATSEDILIGKTAYVNGFKLTGTFVPLDTSYLDAIMSDALAGKTFIGKDGIYHTGTIPTQTIENADSENENFYVKTLKRNDSKSFFDIKKGYYNKTIRVSVYQSPAETVIPTTRDLTINDILSDIYDNEEVDKIFINNITVKGDENLLPENIVSGKTIFGVQGTANPNPIPNNYTVLEVIPTVNNGEIDNIVNTISTNSVNGGFVCKTKQQVPEINGYLFKGWSFGNSGLINFLPGEIVDHPLANNGEYTILYPVYESHTTHTYKYVTVPATCTVDGSIVGTCECGNQITELIPATGHTWDSGVVTQQATTSQYGIKTYTCTVCGQTKTEQIPKIEIPTVIQNYSQYKLFNNQNEYVGGTSPWGPIDITTKYPGENNTFAKNNTTLYSIMCNAIKANHILKNGYRSEDLTPGYNYEQDYEYYNEEYHNEPLYYDDYNGYGPSIVLPIGTYLDTTESTLKYIRGIVYADHPELLLRFKFKNVDASYGVTRKSNGYIDKFILPAWTEEELNKMQSQIDNTFEYISNQVQLYLGHLHEDNSNYFKPVRSNNTNNKPVNKYTEYEKRNIAKIIYEELVLLNEYGDANSTEGINQVLWPAMSYDFTEEENVYKPVCASYAMAFKYCCDMYGIACLFVTGYADGNHAWNVVNYKSGNDLKNSFNTNNTSTNYWQEVDVTWGDAGGYFDNAITYFYFNTTTSALNNAEDGYSIGHHYKGSVDSPQYGNEVYRYHPGNGNCTCTDNVYNGSTIHELY